MTNVQLNVEITNLIMDKFVKIAQSNVINVEILEINTASSVQQDLSF